MPLVTTVLSSPSLPMPHHPAASPDAVQDGRQQHPSINREAQHLAETHPRDESLSVSRTHSAGRPEPAHRTKPPVAGTSRPVKK